MYDYGVASGPSAQEEHVPGALRYVPTAHSSCWKSFAMRVTWCTCIISAIFSGHTTGYFEPWLQRKPPVTYHGPRKRSSMAIPLNDKRPERRPRYPCQRNTRTCPWSSYVLVSIEAYLGRGTWTMNTECNAPSALNYRDLTHGKVPTSIHMLCPHTRHDPFFSKELIVQRLLRSLVRSDGVHGQSHRLLAHQCER